MSQLNVIPTNHIDFHQVVHFELFAVLINNNLFYPSKECEERKSCCRDCKPFSVKNVILEENVLIGCHFF